jgi:AcrR family transcriptional regulator
MSVDAAVPPPVRRRMSHSARHAQLLDVAEELFVEHGYAAVTMEDVARAADVSRPIVYNHFETKEGAYVACVRRARQQWDDEILTTINVNAGPREQLAAGAEQFFSMLERDRGRWLLLFGSNSILSGDYNAELAELRFGTIEAIAVVLRRSASKADMDRIDAWAHAISGVGERLGHWWLARPEMTRAELVDHYTDILWLGLREYVDD